MKHIKQLIVIIPLLAFSSMDKPNVKRYAFRSKYDYSSISLYDNSAFEQFQRSCTYSYTAKGTWEMKGDTIVLNHKKLKSKFGQSELHTERVNKIVKIGQDSLQFVWYKDFGMNHILVLQHD